MSASLHTPCRLHTAMTSNQRSTAGMITRRGLLGCLFAAALLGSAGCGRSDATATPSAIAGKLTITGSSTVAPLVSEIGRRFEQQHPGVRIDVQSGGSSRGVADVRAGLADIGMVSRTLKGDEADLRARTIALDGISLILHRDNPVTALTPAQIVDIYQGRVVRWSQLQGKDLPITVVNKAQGRSTLELFLSYFKMEPESIEASVVIGDNEQGIKMVAGNPGAIGYVSIGSAVYAATHGVPIKLLPLGGVQPTMESVKARSFPLSRPLNLVTVGEDSPLRRAFVEFASSPQAADLVTELYFVPL